MSEEVMNGDEPCVGPHCQGEPNLCNDSNYLFGRNDCVDHPGIPLKAVGDTRLGYAVNEGKAKFVKVVWKGRAIETLVLQKNGEDVEWLSIDETDESPKCFPIMEEFCDCDVLNVIEGHFIIGFADAADQPHTQIQLISEAAGKADIFLEKHHSTREHFDRVADLIKGFETPFGMELLSTVHWVAMRERARTAEQAIKKTYSWNVRKQMFKEEHITIAWKVLEQKEWLPKNGK